MKGKKVRISASISVTVGGKPIAGTPYSIARAQVMKMVAAANAGDADAANELVVIARLACEQIEVLFDTEQGKAQLAEAVKRRLTMPILYEVWRPMQSRSKWEEIIRTLPIGAQLGLKGKKVDQLNMELRTRYIPLFEILRMRPRAEPLADYLWHPRRVQLRSVLAEVRKLPAIANHTAPKWAQIIVAWMEAEGLPLTDPNSWIYKVANPQTQREKRISRALKKLAVKPPSGIEFKELIQRTKEDAVKKWKVNPADVRNGLLATITHRLREN